jgi:hypothetical protein
VLRSLGATGGRADPRIDAVALIRELHPARSPAGGDQWIRCPPRRIADGRKSTDGSSRGSSSNVTTSAGAPGSSPCASGNCRAVVVAARSATPGSMPYSTNRPISSATVPSRSVLGRTITPRSTATGIIARMFSMAASAMERNFSISVRTSCVIPLPPAVVVHVAPGPPKRSSWVPRRPRAAPCAAAFPRRRASRAPRSRPPRLRPHGQPPRGNGRRLERRRHARPRPRVGSPRSGRASPASSVGQDLDPGCAPIDLPPSRRDEGALRNRLHARKEGL